MTITKEVLANMRAGAEAGGAVVGVERDQFLELVGMAKDGLGVAVFRELARIGALALPQRRLAALQTITGHHFDCEGVAPADLIAMGAEAAFEQIEGVSCRGHSTERKEP